jgi:hypothetical protein
MHYHHIILVFYGAFIVHNVCKFPCHKLAHKLIHSACNIEMFFLWIYIISLASPSLHFPGIPFLRLPCSDFIVALEKTKSLHENANFRDAIMRKNQAPNATYVNRVLKPDSITIFALNVYYVYPLPNSFPSHQC